MPYERCGTKLQIRYSQEDAVWIAAAVLLYEKYYCNPGISSDDILLMQYEVSDPFSESIWTGCQCEHHHSDL